MLGCYRNYAILALNCMLNNSERIISASGINKRYRKNSTEKDENERMKFVTDIKRNI